jgi:acetylornithine deacetylase/succinyl-diaminopimelate desuccinylase-like protein
MTDAVRIASELVRIPSVNPAMARRPAAKRARAEAGHEGDCLENSLPGEESAGETAIADYLERFFLDIGVPVARQEVEPGRSNVLAWIPGNDTGRTILFDAHQDTVSASGMEIPPFGGEVNGGKLFGRGACDVKGGMAAMLFAMRRAAAEKPRGAASVLLACTVDEEHAFRGVQRLLGGPWNPSRPVLAIVTEPTLLDVVIAHKGLMHWEISTKGVSCHSASPELGENAIYRMARVVSALEDYAGSLTESPAHPLLGRATMSAGVIRGGTSTNVVPSSCVLEIDRRLVPGESAADALRGCMEAILRKLGSNYPVAFHEPWLIAPALNTPPDAEVTRIAEEAAAIVRGERPPRGVPYGTDAATLSAGGIPAVVLGPGDIAQAHTRDEWIALDQIEMAAEIYFNVIKTAG